MNKSRLNIVLDGIEPTEEQKDRMLYNIINSTNTGEKVKKSLPYPKSLKFVASFILILCLAGTVAYASGILDNILGYLSVESDSVSWSTHKEFLKSSKDEKPPTIELEYEEVFTYDNFEEALLQHDLTIALPSSNLLSYNKYKPTISIRKEDPNSSISHTDFNIKYDLSGGMVEMFVTQAKSPNKIGIATYQFAENSKTRKYETKTGAVFSLLEITNKDSYETAASTLIKISNNETYTYSIVFTDVAKSDVEEVLDSMDMTIYIQE